MKKYRIYFILLLLLVVCATPCIPVKLPEGLWSESLYADKEKELDRLIGLVQPYTGDFEDSRYTLQIKVGRIDMKRSLLGNQLGSSGVRTTSHPYVVPENLPFLTYDHLKKTAVLEPDDLAKFTEWAESYKQNNRADQDGAYQPATAPKSNLEGNSKPQPESEGHSQWWVAGLGR